MSRLPFENVWVSYYGCSIQGECPICNCMIYVDDHQYTPNSWNRSHLISVARGGQDIYPNVRPICVKCNRAMGANDVWTYLSTLGVMTEEYATHLRYEHMRTCLNYSMKCKEYGCNNNRVSLLLDQCNRHLPPVQPMLLD